MFTKIIELVSNCSVWFDLFGLACRVMIYWKYVDLEKKGLIVVRPLLFHPSQYRVQRERLRTVLLCCEA